MCSGQLDLSHRVTIRLFNEVLLVRDVESSVLVVGLADSGVDKSLRTVLLTEFQSFVLAEGVKDTGQEVGGAVAETQEISNSKAEAASILLKVIWK